MLESRIFESLCNAEFYYLELNGVSDVMKLISNKLGIDMSAEFQEAQFQENKTEEIILYIDNLHPMNFVSAGGKYVQLSTGYDLENRKEGIYFLIFQINLNASLLGKTIVKASMQKLQSCLNIPKYLLSNEKNTVELVVSPTMSIPNNNPF